MRWIPHEIKDCAPAVERVGKAYIWKIKAAAFPTVKMGPAPYSPGTNHAYTSSSITVHSAWPERLDNASIFPYLLPYSHGDSNKEFVDFVKQYYQSSCAIIDRLSSIKYQIIGTGCLTDLSEVSTARHVVEGISSDRLYVRFFHYQVVQRDSNTLRIQENCLDVPVVDVRCADNGLDAVSLTIPALKNQKKFEQYTCVVSSHETKPFGSVSSSSYLKGSAKKKDLMLASLSPGKHAMFHFAGGQHQVSIGDVSIDKFGGGKLYNEITIQAGPGASGAGILWQGIGKAVTCPGVSIYRLMRNGTLERRIITFEQFSGDAQWAMDSISAPYHPAYKGDLVARPFYEEGPEFIFWGPERWQMQRPNHPKGKRNKAYNLEDSTTQANHHIIPIFDLLYVWDYFFTLNNADEIKVQQTVNSKIKKIETTRKDKIEKNLSEFYPKDEHEKLRKEAYQDLAKKLNKEKLQLERTKHQAMLRQLYGDFYPLFTILCQPNKFEKIDLHHLNKSGRTYFAWAFWNLFKGWKEHLRVNPPSGDSLQDLSEKRKPQLFDNEIWECLKGNAGQGNGLYGKIQNLKQAITPDAKREDELKMSLRALCVVWQERGKTGTQRIHPFQKSDWQQDSTTNKFFIK